MRLPERRSGHHFPWRHSSRAIAFRASASLVNPSFGSGTTPALTAGGRSDEVASEGAQSF